jgi:PAS domain S-box-containing protein
VGGHRSPELNDATRLKNATSRATVAALILLAIPALHPLLRFVAQDGSHLLWFTHPIAVALIVFRSGFRSIPAALLGSALLVAAGESAFGHGYWVGLDAQTVATITVSVTIINIFAAGFAVYARTGRERYTNLFEHTNDAVFIHSLDGQIRDVNPRAVKMMGLPRAELLELNIGDLLSDSDLSDFARSQEDIAASGHFNMVTRLKHATGTLIPIEVWGIRFESAGRSLIQAVVRDLTRIQEDLRIQTLLTMAVEQTAEAIHIADVHGVVEYANSAFERLTGWSSTDSVGQPVSVLETSGDPAFSEELHAALAAGQVWSGSLSRTGPDGREYDVEVSFSPVRDHRGEVSHVVVVQRDVTKVRQLEDRLVAAQQLESVGTLAGGIAHDFNNLLTPILGYADLTLDDLPDDHELRDDIERIAQAARRGKSLVEQILAFSRRRDPESRPVEVSRVIEEALNLLGPTLPAHIDLRKELVATGDLLLGDATQIHQVVVNLCSNSLHAMRETGGRLTVGLERVEFDEPTTPGQITLPAGSYLRLYVTDTGIGMDSDTASHVFEPFFTTKEPGEGTGLGMSVVHGVVTGHNGDLTVHSAVGMGTRIEIFFPRHMGEGTGLPATEERRASGCARILIVDDEPEVGRVMKKVLERSGHDVTVETRATNALVRITQTPEAFDLLITDQSMPELTGAELAFEALRIRADLPIIIVTGYSESLNAERAEALGIRDYMFKPVRPTELRDAVDKVLTEEARSVRAGS